MKYILLLLLPFPAFSQSGLLPYADGKIEYASVIDAPGYTKEQLHDKAVTFLSSAARNYNNQITTKTVYGLNDFIVLDNKDSGRIAGVSRILAEQSLTSNIIAFDVLFLLKEGRYKYVLSNFKFLGSSAMNALAGSQLNFNNPLEDADKRKNGFVRAVHKGMQAYISQLEAHMKAPLPTNDF